MPPIVDHQIDRHEAQKICRSLTSIAGRSDASDCPPDQMRSIVMLRDFNTL